MWRSTLRLGRLYRGRGDLNRAKVEFETARRLSPASVPAQMELADVYLRLGEPARAVQEYERVVQVRPKDAAVQFGLGVSLAAAGRTSDAAAAFEKSAQLAPRDPEPLRMLARVEVERKRYKEALTALDRAIRSRRSRQRCKWTGPAY